MIYLGVIVLSIFVVLVVGIKNRTTALTPKKYFKYICIIGFIFSLLVGLAQGNFYSHGFDISWWLFSVVNFTLILSSGIVVSVCFIYKKV